MFFFSQVSAAANSSVFFWGYRKTIWWSVISWSKPACQNRSFTDCDSQTPRLIVWRELKLWQYLLNTVMWLLLCTISSKCGRSRDAAVTQWCWCRPLKWSTSSKCCARNITRLQPSTATSASKSVVSYKTFSQAQFDNTVHKLKVFEISRDIFGH